MAGLIQPEAVIATAERIMCRPWDWSKDWHCFGDAADVLAYLTGVDPMARMRGLCAGERDGLRVAWWRGGFVRLVDQECHAAGLQRGPAVTGSIGCIPDAASAFRHVAAICIEPGLWAAKTADGLGLRRINLDGWQCLN